MITHFFKIGSGPAVDDTEGIIRAVSLMELGNAEGHFDKKGNQVVVDETTLKQVYEYCVKNGNLKVKADHGSGVMSTVGWADNFCLTANKVLADFHIYETEPQRPRILEMARKNPDHLGMSLEFSGEDEVKGEHCLARCETVLATALVSDPAANKSLFSAIPPEPKPEKTETNTMEDDTNKDEAPDKFEELSKKFDDLTEKFTALSKKFETPDETADEDPKKELDDNPDSDKDDEETKKIELAAKRGAEAAIKAFSAQLGITQLGKPGQKQATEVKEKHFEEHVAELAVKQFSGDANKARVEILTNKGKHPEAWKSYESSRLVKTA